MDGSPPSGALASGTVASVIAQPPKLPSKLSCTLVAQIGATSRRPRRCGLGQATRDLCPAGARGSQPQRLQAEEKRRERPGKSEALSCARRRVDTPPR